MKKHHQVTGLHFEGDCMVLTIDGREKNLSSKRNIPCFAKCV